MSFEFEDQSVQDDVSKARDGSQKNPFSPLFKYEYPLIDDDELISTDPLELNFPFKVNKPMTSSFLLSNNSDKHVAFRVKTTNLIKYSVQPKKGIVLPHSQTNVTVTMQAVKEAPPMYMCYDKFLVQCVAAPPGATVQDITPEMFNNEVGNYVEEFKLSAEYDVPSDFEESDEEEEETSENNAATVSAGFSHHQITSAKSNKEAGHHVEECKLRAAYVAPPVPEDSEETSENDTSVSAGSSDHQIASTKFKDLMLMLAKDTKLSRRRIKRLQDELVKDIMSMLTTEKQSIIQEINSRIKEEVNQELLKRGPTMNNGGNGLSIYYLVLIAVLGILLVHIGRLWFSLGIS